MAATTTLLGLVTPTQGTLSGTWGDTVNYGISDYVDISVAGTLTLTNDGAVTLANTTGSSSGNSITSSLTGAGTVTAQFAIVRVTGTLTVAKVVTGPSYSKTYTVVNAATGGIVTFKASGQTGVSVAVGESAFVYYNGTDYVKVAGTAAVTSFSAGTTGFTPNTATTGAVTLAGTLATTNGGTGLTSFTSGGVVFASSASVLATGSALTFDGTNLILGSASPNFQGSSSIGSVTLINNSGGAHVRAYGGSHATRADFTEFVNGATTSFINSSGNFGLAVTPSTWSVGKSFEIASVGNSVFGVGAADMRITAGAYYNAAWKYAVTGSAITKYEQTSGVHTWWNAPSGTAGNNATFTQAMTLDASGNLGVGTTSVEQKLDVVGALNLRNSGRRGTFEIDSSGNLWMGTATTAGNLIFETGHSGGGLPSTGTERVKINQYGIGLGASTPSSGTGITFPATQSASSDANTLDDYEEGTWTPVIGGTTSESGQTYSGQTGNYTKVGRLVTVNFRVALTAKGTVAGEICVKGLPFAVQNSITFGAGVTYYNNMGANFNYLFFSPNSTFTRAVLQGTKTAGTTVYDLVTSDITDTTQFNGSFTYFVD